MKRHKKGIRSTKQQIKDGMASVEVKQCINPPLEEDNMNHLSVGLVHVDKKNGIMYTNLTGKFPVALMDIQHSLYFVIGQRMPFWQQQ